PGAGEAKNALDPNPQVAFRASMLPIGNYEDGSIAFPVWPQSAVDSYEAFGRFHRGEAPQPGDEILAGMVMGGSGFGGLASRGARSVAGRALEGVESPVSRAPAGGLAMDAA